jgi:hypothetical protein
LRPAHADQLARAEALVRWRPDLLLGQSDAMFVAEYSRLKGEPLDRAAEYLEFRMEQQTLVAALRRKQVGLGAPDESWGVGARVRFDSTVLGRAGFSPGLTAPVAAPARDLLAAGDARGLEQLLMDVAWRRLDQCAEQGMFAFEPCSLTFSSGTCSKRGWPATPTREKPDSGT